MNRKLKINGIEVEGSLDDIIEFAKRMSFPETLKSDGDYAPESNDDKLIADQILRVRRLSPTQIAFLNLLSDSHPDGVRYEKILKKLGLEGKQFGGMFGSFSKRLQKLASERDIYDFIEADWDDVQEAYVYKLSSSMRKAYVGLKP